MLAKQDPYINEAAATVYQLSQEELIRLQCEAREDYYRRQREIQHKLERLGIQENTIESQNAMLDRQSATIENQNAMLDRQSATIESQNAMLDRQNVTIEKQGAIIASQQEEIDSLKKLVSDIINSNKPSSKQ